MRVARRRVPALGPKHTITEVSGKSVKKPSRELGAQGKACLEKRSPGQFSDEMTRAGLTTHTEQALLPGSQGLSL